jgi:hypothetical protein
MGQGEREDSNPALKETEKGKKRKEKKSAVDGETDSKAISKRVECGWMLEGGKRFGGCEVMREKRNGMLEEENGL